MPTIQKQLTIKYFSKKRLNRSKMTALFVSINVTHSYT